MRNRWCSRFEQSEQRPLLPAPAPLGAWSMQHRGVNGKRENITIFLKARSSMLAAEASFTPTKLGLQRAARCFVDAFRCKREISMLAWWRHEQGCHVTSREVTTLQIAGIVRPLNWIIFSEARCLFVTFYLLWCVVVCTRLLTWSQFLNKVLINFIKLGWTACIRMKKIWS